MSAALAYPPARARPLGASRVRCGDGVRGIGAMWVVWIHVFALYTLRPTFGQELPFLVRHAVRLMTFGHSLVSVFIALSGFCLMLPVAAGEDGRPVHGTREYLRGRARRILPPYYAALALSLLALALVPGLRTPSHELWAVNMPAFDADVVASHLLLLHNLSPHWIFKINAPLWTISTEWEIYFLFPFILLPLWRRVGLAAVIVPGVVLGALMTPRWPLYWGCPWFLAVFGAGMAGAVVDVARDDRVARFKERVPWGALTAVLWATAAPIVWYHAYHRSIGEYSVSLDALVGVATVSLLVYARHLASTGRPRPAIIRFLESPGPVWLGAFSYSLYLVHYPVLAAAHLVTQRLGLSPLATLATISAVGVPVTVAFAYGFHRAFERPFISQRPARAPLVSPATAAARA